VTIRITTIEERQKVKAKMKEMTKITSAARKVATYIKGSIDKPLQFINQLETGDHIVLFYEEPEYARMLTFHYLKTGLMNGDRCVYLVSDKMSGKTQRDKNLSLDYRGNRNEDNANSSSTLDFIKNEMADNRINVSRSMADGLLHVGIYDIDLASKLNQSSKLNDGSQFFKMMLPRPFYDSRNVSQGNQYRLVLDFKTEITMNHQEILQSQGYDQRSHHLLLHNLPGSSICSYPVDNIEETLTDYSEYGQLITERLDSHTGVIFARKFGKGLALEFE
jgi:hypothetical protein